MERVNKITRVIVGEEVCKIGHDGMIYRTSSLKGSLNVSIKGPNGRELHVCNDGCVREYGYDFPNSEPACINGRHVRVEELEEIQWFPSW
jgi:hypothetical protein